MNILLIHNYYQVRGGEDNVFENEMQALKKRGHKIITYTRHNDETKKFSFFERIMFFINSVYNKKTINDLEKILSKNKIDIAHIHNIFPLISPSVYIYLKKKNIKIVQTIHNYRFICPNGQFFRKNKNCTRCMNGNFIYCVILKCYRNSFFLSALYAFIINKYKNIFKEKIDGFIALTAFVKNTFVNAGYDKKKFFIKDNAFTDANIKPAQPKNYFLYLGRISEEKGIDFLLESFSKLDKYKLVIAGSGGNIEQLRSKYNNEKIIFKSFITGKEKIKLISEADALIVPSIWLENYPMTIVESFSCSVPVIASRIGGLPFIIENNVNGLLFEPENFNDLEKKLKIMSDKKNRKKLSVNAKKTFLKRMEISSNIKQLENIYKEIIDV